MSNRFTVFDAMEAKGMFSSNPANIQSRDSRGLPAYKKEMFPMMFYHPTADEDIVVPAEAISTPFGAKMVGEQKRIKTKIAENEAEAAELRAAGWHDHPAKSLKAAGREAPAMSPHSTTSLEEKIAALQKELAEVKANQVASEPLGGSDENKEAEGNPLKPVAKKGAEVVKALADDGAAG